VKQADLIAQADHYEDGWIVKFKDGSAVHLWTEDDGTDNFEEVTE
jgi:hypothetical protein